MTPKKFTRGAFYALFIAVGLVALYYIVDLCFRYWDLAFRVILAVAIAGGFLLLFKLANWAFDDYEKPEYFKYSPMPANYQTPNYFDSEEAGLLSDGRAATPLYRNNKFLGRVPQKPFLNERVGDYRWGKSHHGDWVWIYDPVIVEN